LTLLGKVLFFNSRVSFEAARSPEKGGTERRARSEGEERAREEGMRLAEQALRDAVQLEGSHRADARHYLAQVLLARGQRSEAREELAAYFEELGTGPADDRALRLRKCLGEASRLVSSEERTAAGVAPDERSSFDAIREVDGELEPPRRLSSPQPQYTEAARKARVQGVVIVQVIIEKTGEIRCAKPLVGLPLGLTEATLDAVSEWKFEPARFKGEPVSVFYNFTTNFRLQ
jgi:TonB family protein